MEAMSFGIPVAATDICGNSEIVKNNCNGLLFPLETTAVEIAKLIDEFFQLNVKQYVPDGWVDYSKTKLGYEIPFTRLFSSYQPIRSSEVISKEISAIQSALQSLVKE